MDEQQPYVIIKLVIYMKRLKRLWHIMKATAVDKILIGFLIFMVAVSVLIQVCEPSIPSFGDALWYSFNVVTTIGFGDYYAVTLAGRIATIILGLYGLLIVALIPGVIVSYYMEFLQNKQEETTAMFLEKLEHLDELTKDELKSISEKIKQNRF